MPPHLRMAGLQTQQAQGRIDVVLTGPRGDANGVILSDGAIVRFAPHALQQPLRDGCPVLGGLQGQLVGIGRAEL